MMPTFKSIVSKKYDKNINSAIIFRIFKKMPDFKQNILLFVLFSLDSPVNWNVIILTRNKTPIIAERNHKKIIDNHLIA